MLLKKSYKTAAATFAIVLTTGFVMQNGDAFASKFSTSEVQAQSEQNAPIRVAQNNVSEASTPSENSPLLANQSGLADRVNSSELNDTSPEIPSSQNMSALGIACEVSLNATSALGAMVALDFNAPCHVNETVMIRHQGLIFTGVTTDIGQLSIQIPALVMEANFDVELIDGSTISATVNVPDIASYDRVAVQWAGASGLRIHALEFGADYGERGHVWAKSPQSVATAVQARGGFITELGNIDFPGAKHAEVYSFPTGQMHKSGVVRLSVEAEVTAKTCGKEIEAQALQNGVSGVSIVDLSLAMPSCDAIGDFLVLNNLLRDLKIAQN